MSAAAVVTIEQLALSVRGSDAFNFQVSKPNLEHVLEVALKRLFIAAPIQLELGNGFSLTATRTNATFDLIAHLKEQMAFSQATFGPGPRSSAILDHIRKEMFEVENDPSDLEEWIDIVMLALDGAWRAGHSPELIAARLANKLEKNKSRTWPDWRTAPKDRAIEHVRGES